MAWITSTALSGPLWTLVSCKVSSVSVCFSNQSNHSYSSPSISSTRSGSAFSVATPVKKPDGKL